MNQYQIHHTTNSETRFKQGDIAVVLGDSAGWSHDFPSLHRVEIVKETVGHHYPSYQIEKPDGKQTTMKTGYHATMVPCDDPKCDCRIYGPGSYDIALCDLEAEHVPVSEKELQEVYESLGVDKTPLS